MGLATFVCLKAYLDESILLYIVCLCESAYDGSKQGRAMSLQWIDAAAGRRT